MQRSLGPTRTILITGFLSTTEFEDFVASLNKDDVLETYTVPQTQFLFVIFYDIRKSVDFFGSLNDKSHLNLLYTVSKYEIPKQNEEVSESTKQSSLIIYFKNVSETSAPDSIILKFLNQFGPVKEMRLSKPAQKIIEYCDLRDARKAFSKLDGAPFGQGMLRCRYVWDIMQNVRNEYLKKTDEVLKELLRQTGQEHVVKRAKVSGSPARKDKVDSVENNSDMHPSVDTARSKAAEAGNRNMFVSAFDEYIVNNIDAIERIIKNASR